MAEKEKKYKYVYGRGRSALNLGEAEIRYAMDNTKSNAEAARFLKVSFTTYKKYAKMYTDSESGKTLYDMHTNQAGYGITKNVSNANIGKYSIEKILAGEHPTYPTWKLRNRILALAILPEECSSCGYAERRITDDTVPLLLDHIDGDTTNHRIENIQMLCLNCYYQQTGNPFKQDKETYWNYNRLE
jgi:transposase-like protein